MTPRNNRHKLFLRIRLIFPAYGPNGPLISYPFWLQYIGLEFNWKLTGKCLISSIFSLTRKVHQSLKRKKSESRSSGQRNTISITKKLKYTILTNLIMRFQLQRLIKHNNKRYIRQIYSYELRPFWSIKSQSIKSFDVFFCQTRKHSSRMRSAHFPS